MLPAMLERLCGQMIAAIALNMLVAHACAQPNTNASSGGVVRFRNSTTSAGQKGNASTTSAPGGDTGSAGVLFAHTENTALFLETPTPLPSSGRVPTSISPDESINEKIRSFTFMHDTASANVQPSQSTEVDGGVTGSETQPAEGNGSIAKAPQIQSPQAEGIGGATTTPVTLSTHSAGAVSAASTAAGDVLVGNNAGPAQSTTSSTRAPQATPDFMTTLSFAAPPLTIAGQSFPATTGDGHAYYDINGASLTPGGVVTATVGGMPFEVSLTPDAADLVLVMEDGDHSSVAKYTETLRTLSSSPTSLPLVEMDQTSNADSLEPRMQTVRGVPLAMLGLGFARLVFA